MANAAAAACGADSERVAPNSVESLTRRALIELSYIQI